MGDDEDEFGEEGEEDDGEEGEEEDEEEVSVRCGEGLVGMREDILSLLHSTLLEEVFWPLIMPISHPSFLLLSDLGRGL